VWEDHKRKNGFGRTVLMGGPATARTNEPLILNPSYARALARLVGSGSGTPGLALAATTPRSEKPRSSEAPKLRARRVLIGAGGHISQGQAQVRVRASQRGNGNLALPATIGANRTDPESTRLRASVSAWRYRASPRGTAWTSPVKHASHI